VAVGIVSSFLCPPLSAAAMGGAVYLLSQRDKAELKEASENCKDLFLHNEDIRRLLGLRPKDQ
jgi:hypothetical protein